jgi:hypothetical protein
MSRGPDIGTALARAIDRQSRLAACPVEILAADWESWASATFTGARHRITVSALPGAAAETWLTNLTDAEFAIRGHLVADMVVVAVRRRANAIQADLEVLTVEDR